MHPPPNASDAELPADDVLTVPLPAARGAEPWRLCPVERLSRRRRNQICIAVLALGLANYLVYTLSYAALGGDAHNGHRELVTLADGTTEWTYYLRGHFIHSLDGREQAVSRGVWVYSYLHSISVLPTSGAMIISMLLLARPHILATMRGGLISGQTFVVAFGTIVVLITLAVTTLFIRDFVLALTSP